MGQNTKKVTGGELPIVTQELVPCSAVEDCKVLLVSKKGWGDVDGSMLLMSTAK